MIAPQVPIDEAARQVALDKYQLLDDMSQDSYDDITAMVASICNAPIAMITLIDKERTFFKSKVGVDITEAPRELSFCGHGINSVDEMMIVPDARKDARFKHNPIIKQYNTVFYAGVQLIDNNGFKLGMLCVYDHKPRRLNQNQKKALKALSKQVMRLFEQRYDNLQLEATKIQLRERNEELKDFAGIVSHDLKAPLSNVIMISDLLRKKEPQLKATSVEYLDRLKESAASMSRYIDGMLNFYKSDELVADRYDDISYLDLIEDVIAMTVLDDSATVKYHPVEDVTITSSHVALEQIFINLITNAIKYSDKEHTHINISLEMNENHYSIKVKDNGSGIAPDQLPSIFKLFFTATEKDREGKTGTGIGLATVARLLDHMDGKIDVTSELGTGTEFTITIPIPE